jgi:hypothetical protein
MRPAYLSFNVECVAHAGVVLFQITRENNFSVQSLVRVRQSDGRENHFGEGSCLLDLEAIRGLNELGCVVVDVFNCIHKIEKFTLSKYATQ